MSDTVKTDPTNDLVQPKQQYEINISTASNT